MAYSPQQIIELVKQGKGPTGMYSGGDQSGQLSKLHEEIADDMLRLQGAMQQHWQGDAAGQAYAGAGPLVQASQVSGEHLTQAQGLYAGQGSSFKDLQGKVAAVGDLGNKPQDDWVSDTPLSFLSNRSDEIDAWNQKAQQVVDGYNTYHGQSTDNSGRWAAPSQYGELGLPPGGADVKPAEVGVGSGKQQSGVEAGTQPSSVAVGGSGRHAVADSGGGSGSEVGQSGRHGAGPSVGPGGSGDPISSGGSGTSVRPGGSVAPVPESGTTTAGYVPAAASNGSGGAGFTPGGSSGAGAEGVGPGGFGPGGTGPGGFGPGGGYSPGYGPGGGFGSGSGFGSGGGWGSEGSGGGSGAGPGGGAKAGSGAGGLGPGKGSGVGGLGGEAGSGGRFGGAAGGAARSGGMGVAGGPMGRGGRREEDSEHKTADYLLEADPDDALVGELPKSTPPVIGL